MVRYLFAAAVAAVFMLPVLAADAPSNPAAAQYGAHVGAYPISDFRVCRLNVPDDTAVEAKCTIVGWSNPRVRVIKNCSGAEFEISHDSALAAGAGVPLADGEARKITLVTSQTGGTGARVYVLGAAAAANGICIEEYK